MKETPAGRKTKGHLQEKTATNYKSIEFNGYE